MKYKEGHTFSKNWYKVGYTFSKKIGIRNGYVFETLMARPRPKSGQVHPPGSVHRKIRNGRFTSLKGYTTSIFKQILKIFSPMAINIHEQLRFPY